MNRAVVDVETRGVLDLEDVGTYRYARDFRTEMLCMSYTVNSEPARLWLPDQPVPRMFIEAAKYPGDWLVYAHNAAFERQIWDNILTPRHGFPTIVLQQWRCLMAYCMAMALPGKLERAAKVLELEHQKNMAGHRVMLQLTKPRRARKGEDPDQVYWFDDEERLQKLYHYNIQDTETERELLHAIFGLSPTEQQLWELDQRINDRGFCIDRELATAASGIARDLRPAINAELTKITNGAVEAYTQVARIKAWLEPFCGKVNLDKAAIIELLDSELPDHVKQVIELRALGAQAAVSKVDALLQRTQEDGRLRGAFVFHAAGTGRWASRGAQVHNLKRSMTKDINAAVAHIRTGDYRVLQKHYSNPLSVIGDCTRAMICAAPEHILIGADFSGIEARVTAWLADEYRKLDVFRDYDVKKGPDPYLVSAADIDNTDVIDLAKRYAAEEPLARESRQRGKAAELAFGYAGGVGAYRKFAPDTTLTDEEIEHIKNTWRTKHPNIRAMWRALHHTAWIAVNGHKKDWVPGSTVWCCNDRIGFRYDGSTLWMMLPSGRELAYPNARVINVWSPKGTKKLIESQWGDPTLVFKDAASGMWRDVRTYGGYWTENAVQAIARDLLSEAMLRIDAAGFNIILHVHDECVIEVPKAVLKNGVEQKFTKLMMTLPSWAEGLPVVAKAWSAERYVK